MPITKSAKKALRSSEKKRVRNEKFKTELKEVIKKTNNKNLPLAYSKIDKAVKKHLIHANKAARLKSRLAKGFAGKTDAKKATKKIPKKTKKKTTKFKKTIKKAS